MKHFISKEHAIYAMSADNQPACKVQSGDTIVFEAYDCFTNQITSENQIVEALDWNKINPATGPVFIEGAEPGDVVEVDIHTIDIGDTVTLMTGPELGVLGDELDTMTIKRVPIVEGKLQFTEDIQIPMNKMIGVIGTAPAQDAISCGVPDAHGGNMDTTAITEGAKLYLPVSVKGALLALGDCHAAMGDGEVSVCGGEVPAQVTVTVRVLKNHLVPTPYVINGDTISTIASAKTLDEATVMATKNMVRVIQQSTTLTDAEAIHLLSLAGQLRISQIVDPNKTARMELPLHYLKNFH
ncbi:acetamidase/formamidase family protein [Metasolibacillus sp.]|uniref:acetamidase/formamidase family protein n=1 Tax=Metasolibacillus sp. TaxID=2703680 RepID=UPI0025DDECEC|nr:acetamidase/formamidase family protein [Metasolibacillus sp.]MCT6923208.1 acetamidase/formamidase family protein [Metasolibacillus sp.]MCT6939487.1 acetamidase/formamidase family protein [Metasolibacillus sp.]